MSGSAENTVRLMADLRLDLPLSLKPQILHKVLPAEGRGTFMLSCSMV